MNPLSPKISDRRRGRTRSGRRTPLAIAAAMFAVTGVFLLDRQHQSTTPALSVFPARPESWEVYFSPDGGGTDAIVRELSRAKTSIRVQAYTFTSRAIAKALVEAKRRGVDVCVILDKSQRGERYTSADFIAHGGIPVLIDANHAIAHDKVMVIDGETVITGSFNFTNAAESRNAENLLIIRGEKELVQRYAANWERHRRHSEAYSPK